MESLVVLVGSEMVLELLNEGSVHGAVDRLKVAPCRVVAVISILKNAERSPETEGFPFRLD